jgi:hypothetical protein
MSKLTAYERGDTSWHREQVIKATRLMLERGGTVEDGLDCIVEAARREFGGIRVFVHRPAELRIDGTPFRWPCEA